MCSNSRCGKSQGDDALGNLRKHAQFVGEEYIDALCELGSRFSGKSMVHVNSTYYGGGVAEMLNSYAPLLNEAGLSTEWRLLRGDRDFFMATKKMHNSLQGMNEQLTSQEISRYEETISGNAAIMKLDWYDMVVIDDPQPCGLISRYSRKSPSLYKSLPILMSLPELQKRQPWVWRCHLDLTSPNRRAWAYLRRYLKHYDAIVVSARQYMTRMKKPHHFIAPAIDPLSEKNRPMQSSEISRCLSKNGITSEKPMILQVSRFDPWKDPLGVIEVFRKVRKKTDCQLVLMGSMASDDPEGDAIFKQVFKAAEGDDDIYLITLQSDRLVNALQRRADVVVQKSLREGFGLTVSEAMWKGTPVVASHVGGIPLQIEDGKNGYLCDGIGDCAAKVEHVLRNPKQSAAMGKAAAEKVRQNFLITRLVKDEMALFGSMTHSPSMRYLRSQQELMLSLVKKFGGALQKLVG